MRLHLEGTVTVDFFPGVGESKRNWLVSPGWHPESLSAGGREQKPPRQPICPLITSPYTRQHKGKCTPLLEMALIEHHRYIARRSHIVGLQWER